MNKSEQLIACLEGEIAKRDARIVELQRYEHAFNEWHDKTEWVQAESATLSAKYLGCHRADVMRSLIDDLRAELAACRVAVENCEVFRARIAELEAKTSTAMGVGSGSGNLFVYGNYDSIKAAQKIVIERDQLRAELSAIKAHGNYAPASVVWIDAHHVIEGNNPSFIKDVALVSAEITSETQIPLARLNAAPVQQVSVPDERIIPTSAELIQWAWEEEPEETRFQEGYNAAKRWVKMQIEAGIAAPEAPAADAGLVEALETAVDYLNANYLSSVSSGSTLHRKMRAALAAHSANGVV